MSSGVISLMELQVQKFEARHQKITQENKFNMVSSFCEQDCTTFVRAESHAFAKSLAAFVQGCMSVARSCVTCLLRGPCTLAHMVELAITGLHLFNAQGCFFLNRTGLRVILTQGCVKWRRFVGADEDPFAKGDSFNHKLVQIPREPSLDASHISYCNRQTSKATQKRTDLDATLRSILQKAAAENFFFF